MLWTAKYGFGTLSGRLLLIDYHNPGILQVFQDLSGEHPQGGVHRLPLSSNLLSSRLSQIMTREIFIWLASKSLAQKPKNLRAFVAFDSLANPLVSYP